MSPRSLLVRTLLALALSLVLPLGALAQSCALGFETIPEGKTERLYRVPSVPRGVSCDAQAVNRTCRAGQLSGEPTARYGSCTVIEGFTGVNVNRRPSELRPDLLARTGTRWIRASVDILRYADRDASGKADPNWNFADWQNYKAATARPGRKGILNLMWDFEGLNRRIPLPGSREEKALFDYLDARILTPLAASATIITTGNEPFVNTSKSDLSFSSQAGGIPIVVFYQRVTQHVDAWLTAKGLRNRVQIYVGAFTRLHTADMQGTPAVRDLLAFADESPFVDGIDMHIHAQAMGHLAKAIDFVQGRTAKPIIVTEYSMVFAMRKALEGGDRLGKAFAARWGLDPKTKSTDYLTCRVFHRGAGCEGQPRVSKAEWDDFLSTRDWHVDNFLLRANEIFRREGVHGSTYDLIQNNPSDRRLKPDSLPWYLGTLFSEASLGDAPDGMPYPNYQMLDDFLKLPK